ncbi:MULTISPECIES: TetR/AcrR family transcriptional regulator C-terminal domain-containing protein [unclassified Rhizobium]|uniref:TetR/AcrR family transcriptional regulator C-terminal domain-containing protein n=1 Tax=unclassified Rhizobium TaxID=2613769 RepID=UPI001612D307|nr:MULTISPECIES: TetR/AcrR family transcriptional regulator C-terminal domain-containing protein [unclassified Rhizobium]MBB3291060.1 TetR/AcrR family tetracycline transcriptional repressor [Rhizobium sp. BK252]MBB3405806.1 TetR/AcrR family tetracycline transcriptional repressor [Rhizobium sp. BK289]MBB3418354.1 TetR/AcrR family tetracycline transcriptional repressor [Rhizobium sp. BK284]MBB3486232.1 TetR/AcrR family tetracycline transcriptional repressor [Rhizobium sp. BK347]
MKIDRNQIVDVALTILNEVGIDSLSTRLIAQRLGVQQPALYWHFKGKQALLAAMNAEMLRRKHSRNVPLAGETWQEFLRANARSFRSTLLAWRDGARVHAGTEVDPLDLDAIEAQLECLLAAGFDAGKALELQIAISRYVVGCVLEEQADAADPPDRAALDAAAESHPNLAKALTVYRAKGHEALFEAGLELLIGGAETGK